MSFRDCSNLSIISSQCSQFSDFGLTPKDSDQPHASFSPMRKKGKPGRLSRMLDTENNPSLFNLVTSQDSFLCESQTTYSQEVTNRLGQLTCKNEASMDGFEDSASLDAFVIPTMPSTSAKAPSHSSKSDVLDGEKKIVVAPAVTNPFLSPDEARPKRTRKPTTIWIQPYKERPRYLCDFEEEGVLGEGSFSVVYAARKRLDGALYAVKKLKVRIGSESEGISLAREVCALAALKGCPNLIQYFGSWVEDGHLWVQTELCLKVTLDIFVVSSIPRPSLGSRYNVPASAVYGSSEDDMLMMSANSDLILSEDQDKAMGCVSSQKSVAVDRDLVVTSSSSFREDVFWHVLAGVCNALAFMHSKGS